MKLFKKDLLDNKDGMRSEWKKANKEAIRQTGTISGSVVIAQIALLSGSHFNDNFLTHLSLNWSG